MDHRATVHRALKQLHSDTQDFALPSSGEVPIIDTPSLGHFFREYVRKNRPVVIRSLLNKWKAMKNWDLEYFESVAGDVPLSVACTPTGFGKLIVFPRTLLY